MPSTYNQQRSFVLGLGVSKTGTTWLFNYLNSFPQVNMGIRKEYHVFDAVHISGNEYIRVFRGPNLGVPDKFLEKTRRQFQTLESFREDHEKYYAYFDGLMDDDIVMSGDVTPSYFGLPAFVLSEIKQQFGVKGINVKPVVFLRDPIDRVLSLARMVKRLGTLGGRKFDRNEEVETIVRRFMDMEHVWLYTDYKRAIDSIFEAFHRENVYVGAYEMQFQKQEFLRLNQFLQLEAKPEWLEKHFNASRRGLSHEVSAGFLAQLRDELAPQFKYCHDTFPEFDIQVNWPNFAGRIKVQ